jgi:hypothetical protein
MDLTSSRKMKVSRVIHIKEITNISVMFGGLRKMTDAISPLSLVVYVIKLRFHSP